MDYNQIREQINSENNFIIEDKTWNNFISFMKAFKFKFDSYDLSHMNNAINHVYDIHICFKTKNSEVNVYFDRYGGLQIRFFKENKIAVGLIIRPVEDKFVLNANHLDSGGLFDLGLERNKYVIRCNINYFNNADNRLNESRELSMDCSDENKVYPQLYNMVSIFLDNPREFINIVNEEIDEKKSKGK